MTGCIEQSIQEILECDLDGEHEARRSFAGWLIRHTTYTLKAALAGGSYQAG